MKRIIIAVFLLGALLVPPLVLAQEQTQPDLGQTQHYSGFSRFFDNVKMFFSFGDKKVMLALDIREKELNSAIINIENGENKKAEKNIQRAKNKLQHVQKKVSKDIAKDVKTNIGKIINKINEVKNLPNNFETYILEEEKTQLTAELVIEVEGKEGQILIREIVKDDKSGKNKVEITVDGDVGQTKVMEIEGKIGEIDNQIAERVVKTEIAKGDDGLTPEIKTDNNNSDDGLTPEVKTHTVGDGTEMNDPLPIPDLNQINPDLYNPNARAPGDTFEEDNWVEKNEIDGEGDCGDGVVCEGDSVIDYGVDQVNNIFVTDKVGTEELLDKINNEGGMAPGTNNEVPGDTIVSDGDNVVKTGMDVDLNKIDPNATPKTPIPTDGSICCKKTRDGETRYHWDYEADCLNPEKIEGEVVDTDVCPAF